MRLPQSSRLPSAASWKASEWLILSSPWRHLPRAATRLQTGSVRCSQQDFLVPALQTYLHGCTCQREPCAITSLWPCRNLARTIGWRRHDLLSRRDGCHEWKLPWPDSPHLHINQFFPTALLSQTASKDTNVLPDFARELHQRLAPYYAQAPERLRYIEYANSPHDLMEEDWEQAWNCVVRWFETFLSC